MQTRRVLYQTAIRIEKENALSQSRILCETLKSAVDQFADNENAKQQLCFMRRKTTAKSRRIKALSAESHAKDNEIKRRDQMLAELKADLFEKKQILLREKCDKQKLQNRLETIKDHRSTDDGWKRAATATSNNLMTASNLMTYRSIGDGGDGSGGEGEGGGGEEFRCGSASNVL